MERHGRIEDDRVEAAGGQQLERPFAVGGQHAHVPGGNQRSPGRQQGIRLIVDDEDPGHAAFGGDQPPTTATPAPSVMRPTS
jgi:hypothetical protein